MVCRKSASALIAFLVAPLLHAGPLPEADGLVHEGVASCASSICHGRVEIAENSNVWLTEYRVWLREDPHAGAYKTLLNDDSIRIARNLGLENAHEAQVCLACHADNVPAELRGDKFHIEDGVGCEACHGGSEQYLLTHTEMNRPHKLNLEQGMYPTDQPADNAALCLSCHLGTSEKLATHEIMGAGHPRLSFELLAYSINQPVHYSIDADYRERKTVTSDLNTWLYGLVGQSRAYLDLLSSSASENANPMAEFALYQCHACHRPMAPFQWEPDTKFAGSLVPGALRLNDGPITVLITVLERLDAALATEAMLSLNQLHRVTSRGTKDLALHSNKLDSIFAKFEASLSQRAWDNDKLIELFRHLVQTASAGEFHYFTQAEHVFLAAETIAITAGIEQKMGDSMTDWYATMLDENHFSKAQFAQAASRVLSSL